MSLYEIYGTKLYDLLNRRNEVGVALRARAKAARGGTPRGGSSNRARRRMARARSHRVVGPLSHTTAQHARAPTCRTTIARPRHRDRVVAPVLLRARRRFPPARSNDEVRPLEDEQKRVQIFGLSEVKVGSVRQLLKVSDPDDWPDRPTGDVFDSYDNTTRRLV